MERMNPTLLVMAAGMGSRYGGLKQIEPVGPHDETIIDYSVYDAVRAGFRKVVFVIRRDIETPFRQAVGARFEGRCDVRYVFQELDEVPLGFAVPPGRQKPWGTAHAILVAANAVDEPFAVINGDDFYGRQSFQLLADHLRTDRRDHAMVGFVLRHTLSDFGGVARGVCQVNPDGYLSAVVERFKVERDGHGAKYADEAGVTVTLSGDEPVSMNMWGFQPSIFEHLRTRFAQFLSSEGLDDKAELYIPKVVNELIHTQHLKCRVLRTPDSWYGVTYREDRLTVVESIGRLVDAGVYPDTLS